jgi:hypothetical protein
MPPSALHLIDFMFFTIARKLPPISLREGAAVARYLGDLTYEVAPGPSAKLLKVMANSIWASVFQLAKFKSVRKAAVLEFLEKFEWTHLIDWDVKSALEIVRSAGPPQPHHMPPMLQAPFMRRTLGTGAKRLSDDLTERICAGYWALRFGGVSNARKHIAAALNRHGIQTRARRAGTAWTGYEVAERVKQYEEQALRKRGQNLMAARHVLVKKWNLLYYPNSAWEKLPN